MVPALLSISLDKTFNKVDFPAPFFPINPILSPLFSLKVIPENRSVPMKETVKLCTLSINHIIFNVAKLTKKRIQ